MSLHYLVRTLPAFFITSFVRSKLILQEIGIIDKNVLITIQLSNLANQKFIDNYLSITIPTGDACSRPTIYSAAHAIKKSLF